MVDFSSGFKDDCEIFLSNFRKHKSPEFRYFCEVWRSMQMQYIFYGRSDYELIAFMDDCFLIIKHIFCNAVQELDKIAAFYMMYALYFKQPTKEFVKVRFTYEQWLNYREFVHKQERNYQINLVFWKMFAGDAYRFVFHNNEMGLELMYNSGRCRSSVKIGAEEESESLSTFNLLTEIENMQNQETGLMTAMDLIEIGYNDMKEKLEATKNPLVGKEAGLALLPQSDFGTDVHKTLEEVYKIVASVECPNMIPDNNSSMSGLPSTSSNISPKRLLEHGDSEDYSSSEDDDVGSRRKRLKKNALLAKTKQLRVDKRKAKREEKEQARLKSRAIMKTKKVDHRKDHRRKHHSLVANIMDYTPSNVLSQTMDAETEQKVDDPRSLDLDALE